jgi:16S rRNA (guanine527-N7)-methyltransferase
MTNDQLTDLLSAYRLHPTDQQCDQIRSYISLLLRWNRSISLTTVTDEGEIVKFHFGESGYALSVVPGMDGRLADVGPGAGFPGLALRIFSDSFSLTLIESNAKKCVFLSEVIRELRLERVSVVHGRFEDIFRRFRRDFSIVTSRALGNYEQLLKWSAPALAPGGRLVMWLGESDARKITTGSDEWVWLPFAPIPGSSRRGILVGSPRN